MKNIVKKIAQGQANEVTSLVETALRQKLFAALITEKQNVAADIYGSTLKEAVSPGGNKPGTKPSIKPKDTGIGAKTGQKNKNPKQSKEQQAAALNQQVVAQRKAAMKARDQAMSGDHIKPDQLANARIATEKMKAAKTKLALLKT